MAESLRTAFAHNLHATTNPGVSSDITQGYSAGSIWINTTAQQVWFCTDGSVGAAAWTLASSNAAMADSNTGNLSNTTFTAGLMTGGSFVVYTNYATVPGTLTTRTASQLFTETQGAGVGQSYVLRVVNSGIQTLTLQGGTGVTIQGGNTVKAARFSDWAVTFVSATATTMTFIGDGPNAPELGSFKAL